MTPRESLVAFIREAVAGLNPEREKSRASSLRGALANLDEGEDVWGEVVAELDHDPALFTQGVHLVALYVDEHHTDCEPGHGACLLRSALVAGIYDLAVLVDVADPGYFWTALAQILAELELVDNLVFQLARSSRPQGSLSPDALQRWAVAHPSSAKRTVDDHLEDLVQLSHARHNGLVPLVEGAVEVDLDVVWRDQIVAQLLADVDERSQALGVQLACWAWPAGTDVAVRHQHVLETVRVFPRARAGAALQALRRDAFSTPLPMIETVLCVTEMVRLAAMEPNSATQLSAPALDAMGTALYHLRKAGTPSAPDDRISALVFVTTPRASQSVDSVLAEFYRADPDAAFNVLAGWLSRFGQELRHASMRDTLSLLVHEVGPGVMACWYVRLLTHESARLRASAAHLFAHEDPPQLDLPEIEALSSGRFEALVHQLLGIQAVPAEHIARIILSFVEVRTGDGDFLKEVALELASLYPGACRDEATRRRGLKAASQQPTVSAEIEEMVLRVLEERSERLTRVRGLPEVASGWPALAEYWHFDRRQQRWLMDQAQGRSVLVQIAARAPIACGEGTVQTSGATDITRFASHEFSTELPAAGAVDPVGDHLRRIQHLARAELLVAQDAEDQR